MSVASTLDSQHTYDSVLVKFSEMMEPSVARS